jgi:transposase InsO family protein
VPACPRRARCRPVRSARQSGRVIEFAGLDAWCSVVSSASAQVHRPSGHSIVDGFSRLAYTEPPDNEKGTTAAAFLTRAKVSFAAHGITHIHRIVTDNGACYRSNDFARIVGQRTRRQKIKACTPRHNGKAERYRRIMTEELL